jgi:hypothetical protein
MRITLVEEAPGVSFVASPTALAVLVAACARNPQSVDALLDNVAQDDPDLTSYVKSGLAVFDEHNSPGHYEHIHATLQQGIGQPSVFRIVDEVTRQRSLQPFRWGLVLFNLTKQRIIQIENTYAEVKREGHVPTFPDEAKGRPQRIYRLPTQWQIIP